MEKFFRNSRQGRVRHNFFLFVEIAESVYSITPKANS
jgi:hypothetical protein